MPQGLSLRQDSGTVTGEAVALTETPARVTVQVAQADGQSAQAEVEVSVLAAIKPQRLRILSGPILPPAAAGTPYEAQLAADGGIPPYTWRTGQPWPDYSAGTLRLSESGRLTNPVFPTVGTHVLQAVVADASGTMTAREMKLAVREEGEELKLRITSPEVLPSAISGREYRLAPSAEGGWGYYTWTLEGDLPDGLRFVEGRIVGTPTQEEAEARQLLLRVQDAAFDSAEQEVSLAVIAGGKARDVRRLYLLLALVLLGYAIANAVNRWLWSIPRERLVRRGEAEVHQDQRGTYVSGPSASKYVFYVKCSVAITWVIRLLGFIAAGLVAAYG